MKLPDGVKKMVLKEAPSICFRRPKAGDKVRVDYTGWLEDRRGAEFDSSKGKEPATFFLGQGEVIKGWEAAIPTMKEGEIARLTIAPEFAYGKTGMMPKIPPDSTLVFEVELLGWECKDNLFGDWGCVRTVLEEGEGYGGFLENGMEVEISIRAEAEDGRTLEERQHVGYRIGSGSLGQLSRVADRALGEMKKKSKVELRCKPEYAYGNPSHGEVLVRIELHELYDEEDVSPNKDKSVIKKQIREGNGNDMPRDAAKVQLKVEAVRGISGILLAGFDGPKVLDFTSGNGEICDALELAVGRMSQGERAIVTCTNLEYCKDINLFSPDDLPVAGDKVMFTVELNSFENEKNTYDMADFERVEFAAGRKEIGSKLFREQRTMLALERYKGALDLLSYTENWSEEAKAKGKALKLTCQLNQAQCFLNLGQHFEAKVACDSVLAEEPNNTKALFRRAKAQLLRRDFVEALPDFKRLLELEPDNPEAKRLCLQAQRGAKEAEKKAVSMYAKMSKVIGRGKAVGPPLEFRFEPKPDTFSALYLDHPASNTAAVNAGDYRLYVGGAAINRAFADLLKKEQGIPYPHEDYQTLHEVMLRGSRERGSTLVSAKDLQGLTQMLRSVRLATCYCRAGEVLPEEGAGGSPTDVARFGGAIGSVFVDVFEEKSRPLHEKNVAMLYVVGPKGEGCAGPKREGTGPLFDRAAFIAGVEKLATNALELVAAYNDRQRDAPADQRFPLIEEIRWCLVSGGVYRHESATKLDVARATIRGMKAASGTAGLAVTFTYDENVFQLAAQAEDEGT